ncbi:glycerophosphodiester phosphodiesterase family protein [Acinetobacter sp. WZC-1]|uniref:glycerophosphodiester phosphodiesterase family protein n=1 Tax=Acinetobacter sp. WZC-1 TaxID=3459034 RepID=UPI00403E30D5
MIKKALLGLCLAGLLTACNDDKDPVVISVPEYSEPDIIIIGHRGASALRPEHTLASYQQAMDDGADFIEPDLVLTKDNVLIARHENEISETTNISTLSQFADRKTTKQIECRTIKKDDCKIYTGWFTEDFTANELSQNVRARERLPQYRPDNAAYNDQFPIPTLDQIIDLVEQNYKKTGKIVGLYIETKHPTYFKHNQQDMDGILLKTLAEHEYTRDIAPVYLQSFEVNNLKEMRKQLEQDKNLKHVKFVQLLDNPTDQPADYADEGSAQTTYADMATPEGLKQIATYAEGVGPSKTYIFSNTEFTKTSFIEDAHTAGLKVHPYTMRPENDFMPEYLRCGTAGTDRCESGSTTEFENFFKAGVDGLFADDPGFGRRTLDAYLKNNPSMKP